jgi:K+-transporting ATPase ATPase C chain
MLAHIRVNALLLVATLVICSVLYPLVLWLVGQGLFPEKASGSLIRDGHRVIGSRLIAQKFEGAGYFQPRPSATAGKPYNAAASGGSNLAANNVRLRQRVAAHLSGLVTYASGPRTDQPAGPDVVLWFLEQTDPKRVKPGVDDVVTRWARDYPTLASDWVKSDDVTKDYVRKWPRYADLVKEWHKYNPDAGGEPEPEQLAAYFFASFAQEHPQQWPQVAEEKGEGGKAVKKVELIPADPAAVKTREDADKVPSDIRETFFDLWLQKNPDVDLGKVPADMVTASGSGLDPHISRASAKYQSKRVITERTRRLVEDEEKGGRRLPEARKKEIRDEVQKRVEGLIGDAELVNVLEINLALDAEMKKLAR